MYMYYIYSPFSFVICSRRGYQIALHNLTANASYLQVGFLAAVRTRPRCHTTDMPAV